MRQLAQIAGSFGGLAFVGTPATIADEMEQWLFEEGCDGFNIMFPYVPEGLDDFVDKVVPELQRRGLFRREYEGRTLRENLGLPRPENQFFSSSKSSDRRAQRRGPLRSRVRMEGTGPKRLGFFTRLLDQATAGERYRLATEQIVQAERRGFDSAWVAQHHFDGDEGGLPAPFVFLAHVAARTSRIRLGTGIVTLPLENPVRVAEDAAVFDLISGGRLELGLGSGGTPSAFAAFGRDSADRAAIFDRQRGDRSRRARRQAARRREHALSRRRPQLATGSGRRPFRPPAASAPARRATASCCRAPSRGRKRRRTPRSPTCSIRSSTPISRRCRQGREPRILGSRTLFVADDRREALGFADIGLRRVVDHFVAAVLSLPADRLPISSRRSTCMSARRRT